jgi:hypothetical protein
MGTARISHNYDQLEELNVSPLTFDGNELQLVSYQSDSKQTVIKVQGNTLDLSKARFGNFAQMMGNDGPKKTLSFESNLKRLVLKNNETIHNLKTVLNCGINLCHAMDTSGTIADKHSFVATIKPELDDYRLIVESDNAGAVLNALDISKHIRNGQLYIEAKLSEKSPPMNAVGVITINDFLAVKTPLLGKLLTLASFGGISDLLEGKGINFKQFEAPFTYKEGVLTIDNARSTGASVGITAQGVIDTKNAQMDITGSIIPAQAINDLFNRIPVVGSIITGGQSQGVIAANYRIKGSLENAEASVNPLSIITPGFLRQILSAFPDISPPNPIVPSKENTEEKPSGEMLKELWETTPEE